VAAVACSGVLGSGAVQATPESDVVLLDATQSPPSVIKHFGAAEQLGAPVSGSLAFVSETKLFGTALGDTMAARNDVAYTLDTESGKAEPLYDAGAAFALGDLMCAPGCSSALCLLADAQANALAVWQIRDDASLKKQKPVVAGQSVGLPPRALGSL
jgi:hypothetical protein